MVADQCFQRVAPSAHCGLFAAQLVGAGPQAVLFGPVGLQTRAQRRNLAFQPLQRLGSGLKFLPGQSVLHA